MDAIQAILSRRSINKYTSQPVPPDVVEELLKAAMSAPSAGNEQPWHFVVINDRKILDEIPYMPSEAPAAILVCGYSSLTIHGKFWIQGCLAATENILIAANATGLGAVWLGMYPAEERITEIRKLLGIPENVVPVSLISIGYPAEHKPPADRYNTSKIHHNHW
jgi:nitroreductase